MKSLRGLAASFMITGGLLASTVGFAPPSDGLTPQEMARAIVIDAPNRRTREVRDGENVVYRVRGTDTYLRITASRESGRAGHPAPVLASVTYTQVCGINVYLSGLPIAQLRNRANVTYFTGQTRAPARFNWADMRGTQTLSMAHTWSQLNQFTVPGLGVTFQSSGGSQASANLTQCVFGVCKSTYFVSRLWVRTSGTSCQ
ncbi:MAG: hypothetical protein WD906_01715 [Anaerolineales bacterium]